jgi:hypothetical protein
LREISNRVVLVRDVDGGDTGVGRLGAVEVETRRPRDDQTGEPLPKSAVGAITRTEQQKSDVRRRGPGLDQVDFFIDRDLRALRSARYG